MVVLVVVVVVVVLIFLVDSYSRDDEQLVLFHCLNFKKKGCRFPSVADV